MSSWNDDVHGAEGYNTSHSSDDNTSVQSGVNRNLKRPGGRLQLHVWVLYKVHNNYWIFWALKAFPSEDSLYSPMPHSNSTPWLISPSAFYVCQSICLLKYKTASRSSAYKSWYSFQKSQFGQVAERTILISFFFKEDDSAAQLISYFLNWIQAWRWCTTLQSDEGLKGKLLLVDREILLTEQAGRLLQDKYYLQAKADSPEGWQPRREGKHKLSSRVLE